jgi:hypothetical protein
MYGIVPEDDTPTADFYFRRMHPEDRPGVEQAYAAALLRKTDFEADFPRHERRSSGNLVEE